MAQRPVIAGLLLHGFRRIQVRWRRAKPTFGSPIRSSRRGELFRLPFPRASVDADELSWIRAGCSSMVVLSVNLDCDERTYFYIH